MTGIAALAVLGTAWLLGRTLHRTCLDPGEDGRGFAVALSTLVGIVVLYGWMQALDAAGVGWTIVTVCALPLVAGLLARPWRRAGATAFPVRPGLGWGDVGALVALVLGAVALTQPGSTMSDVVFHWGFKAQRYALVGGIDIELLRAPWNLQRHPDYPNLVPAWWTATALLRGAWTPGIPLFSTVASFALLVVSCREALRVGEVDTRLARPLAALVPAVVVGFATAFVLGGSLDVLVAALVLTALPALLGAPSLPRAGQIGWVAAALVGAKSEGLPLAVLLIGAAAWRIGRAEPRRAAVAGRLLVPPLAIGLPWWWKVAHWELAQEQRFDATAFDADRVRTVVGALGDALLHPAWHGFALVLLLLPWLLACRATRLAALVLGAQLAFYLAVYLTTPTDPAYLVTTSAQRLALHVVPAILVLFGVAASAKGPRAG